MKKLLVKVIEQADKNLIAHLKGLFFRPKISPLPKRQYLFTISEAAKFLGVSADTLRNWETLGKITPQRTKGGARRFRLEQLNQLLSQNRNRFKLSNSIPNYDLIHQNTDNTNDNTNNDISQFDAFFSPKRKIPIKLVSKTIITTISLISLTTLALIYRPQLFSNKPISHNNPTVSEDSQVLGITAEDLESSLDINIPTNIFNDLTVKGKSIFEDNITAPNIIYSLTAGDGLSITSGQDPTIKNTGVLSLQNKTGKLSLTEGTDITIDGLKIINKSTLDSVRGRGGCSSCITDADVAAGLTISGGSVNNSPIGASTASTGAFTTLSASSTLAITGATTLSSTLSVTGVSTLTGAVTASSTLAVTGATTLNGNVTLGDASSDTITFTGRVSSNIVPSSSDTYTLGTSSLPWSQLYLSGVSTLGGQSTFTAQPTGTGVGNGSIYINPASVSDSSYTLFGIAVGGTEKLRMDATGNITVQGNLVGPTGGSIGYWSRSGALVYPYTIGDTIGTFGNVGVGTTGTSASLYVNGNAMIGYSSGGPGSLSNGLAVSGNVGIGTSSPSTLFHVRSTGSSTSLNTLISSGGGLFGILDNGNVGIGTTNPSAPLNVVGPSTAWATGAIFTAGGQSLTLAHNNGGGIRFNLSGGLVIDPAGTSGVGTFNFTSSALQLGTTWTIPSITTAVSNGGYGFDLTLAPSTNGAIQLAGGNFTASSGTEKAVRLSRSFLETGTANAIALSIEPTFGGGASAPSGSYTGLLVNVTEGSNVHTGINKLLDLQVKGISKFVVSSLGNIGIGTTGPGSKLSVFGGVGIGNTGANGFAVSLAPSLGLAVQGNVGVGTTSPAGALHVVGQCVSWDTKIKVRRRKRRFNGEDDEIEYNYLELMIKDILPGDEVLSLNEYTQEFEYQAVEKLLDMGTKGVYELVTKSGKRIKTTGNHPYLTHLPGVKALPAGRQAHLEGVSLTHRSPIKDAGWIKVTDLKVGDKIAVANREDLFSGTTINSRISNYNNNQQQNSANNIESFQRTNHNIHSFVPFNNHILTNQDIKVNIAPAIISMGEDFSGLSIGVSTTEAKKTSPKLPDISDNLLSWTVDKNLSIKNDAITSVNSYQWDKIVSIRYIGYEHVYDLQIANTHNFVGNNIVAHNTYINGSIGIGANFTGVTIPANGLAVSGNVGIGTTSPQAPLDVNSTNTQFRLSYDGTYFATESVSSAGALTIDTNSTGAINIGTGSNAKTVTIGNGTGASALALTSGTGSQTFTSSVASTSTTSSAWVFTDTALTTGTGMYLNSGSTNNLSSGNLLYLASTSTALTTGSMFNSSYTGAVGSGWSGGLNIFDYSPSSVPSTSPTGDLLRLSLGTNATNFAGNIFNILDNSSSVFSISKTAVTTSLPFNETAPGDVSIAYDIAFSNPTASFIKSDSNLSIVAGEVFNSSNLTLATYNSGQIILDSAGGVVLSQYQPWTLSNSSTMAWNIQDSSGNNLLTFDTTNQRVGIGITGPASKLDINGNLTLGASYVRSYGAPTNGLLVQGNVGIGTSNGTGAFNLDVAGTGRFSSTLSLPNGSATTPALNFANLTNAGLWQANNIISLTNAGAVSGLAINSSGNVGVGTTSPLGNLHVVGQCVAQGTRIRRRRRKNTSGVGSDSPDVDSWIEEDIPVEDIAADDEVLSLDDQTGQWEWKKVEATLNKGIQTVYRLETESGKWIETTSEHPYLVRGISISNLSSEMFFALKLNKEYQSQKQYYQGQTQSYIDSGSKISQINHNSSSISSILTEINIQPAKSIRSITNAFRSAIPNNITNNPAATLVRSDDITLSWAGRSIITNPTLSDTKIPVNQTDKWIKVSQIKNGQYIATSDGWEKITAITKVGRKQTYDLQIAGTHNFVGNNIVAHNTFITGNTGIGALSNNIKLQLTGNGTGTGVNLLTQNSTQSNFGLSVLDNGNVGIGTTSPTTALHVVGNTKITGQILASNGSASAPGISFANGPTTGLALSNANPDYLAIVLQGSTQLTFTNGGEILPGLNNTISLGRLNSTILAGVYAYDFGVGLYGSRIKPINSYWGGIDITSTSAVSGGLTSFRVTPAAHTTVISEVNDINFASHTMTITGGYATQRFSIFNQPAITAASALNISSEATTLSIAGAPISAGSATIANAYGLKIDSSTSVAAGVTNAYGLSVAAPTGATNNYSAVFHSGNVGIGTTTPSLAKFQLQGSGTSTGINLLTTGSNLTQGLAVLDNGNVGVGTTSPLGNLHVVGQCVTGDTLLKRRRRRRVQKDSEKLGGPDPSDDQKTRNSDSLTLRSSGNLSHSEFSEYVYDDVRIDQITPGDEILTLDETTGEFVYQQVKGLMDMGIKDIYELITETGKSIKTTANHPYLTQQKTRLLSEFFDGLHSNELAPDLRVSSLPKNNDFVKFGVEVRGIEPPLPDFVDQEPHQSTPTGLLSQTKHQRVNPSTLLRMTLSEAEWIKVSQIRTGMKIATIDGWEKVISITHLGREKVFDIEVENTHNFVGNNIVAHNTYLQGNLGIGTASPQANFHLAGSGTGTGVQLLTQNSTQSNFGLSVLDNGNVGIGTTTPQGTLDVRGNIVMNEGSSFQSWNNASILRSVFTIQSGTPNIVLNNGNSLKFGTASTGIQWRPGGIDRALISATTNSYGVNIQGAAVAGGEQTLVITPPAHTAVTSEVNDINFASHTMTITGGYATQRFSIFNQPTITAASALNISTEADTLNIGGPPISAGSATIANAVALRISSGTSVASGVTNSFGLYVDAPTGATNNYSAVFHSGNVGIGTTTPSLAKFQLQGSGTSTGINLLTTGSNLTQGLAVLDNGNVGVGTTSPLGNLHVVGQCVTWDTRIRVRRRRRGYGAQGEDDEIEYDYLEVMIKDILEGDEVLSLNEVSGQFEYQAVEKLLDMGTKGVYELVTKSGKRIKTTSEHPYLVKEVLNRSQKHHSSINHAGWIKVTDLKVGDQIAVAGLSAMTGFSFPVFDHQDYGNNTQNENYSSNPKGVNNLIHRFFPFLTNHTAAIKPTIAATPFIVNNFKNATPVRFWDSAGTMGMAASQVADRLVSNPDRVSSISLSLPSFINQTDISTNQTVFQWDTITSIEYLGYEHVYDLQIENTHNFVGNNIVAHNTYITSSLGLGTNFTGATTPTNGLAVQGNIGIGTTTANSKLTVIGGATVGADYGVYTAPANGLLVQGNVGIGTSVSSNPLTVGIDGSTGNGAYLSAGGTWTNGSSFEFKENFSELDRQWILKQINALNISSWNYKLEPGIKHIGPLAEQFYELFKLGNDNKHISTIDPAGIALLGIQGLYQEISNLKLNKATDSAKIATSSAIPNTPGVADLKDQIASLSARISKLELGNKQEENATSSAQTIDDRKIEDSNLKIEDGKLNEASLSSTINPQNTTFNSLPSTVNDLKLTDPSVLLATGSAKLANIPEVSLLESPLDSLPPGMSSDATVSGMLKTYNLNVSESLKVFGNTTIGKTNIAGDLIVDGTMSINGSSISSLGDLNNLGILYLQNSPLAKGIDIFNGKVIIDNQGNLVTQGEITAKKLNVTKGSAGTAALLKGQTSIYITNSLVDKDSIITITPRVLLNKPLAVTNQQSGGFTVEIAEPEDKDIKFNYLIVGVKQ